jgi:peroxiredoxin
MPKDRSHKIGSSPPLMTIMARNSFLCTLLLSFAIASFAFVPSPRSSVSIVSGTSSSVLFSSTANMPEVKTGDTLPDVVLKELPMGSDRPQDVKLHDLCAGKTVAIFGVPGAFTPGCSKSHLPSFITAQEELTAKGVDLTLCVATNDAYVMEAWGRTSGGSDSGIRFLSDDTGALTKALGLEMPTPILLRTKRFSLIAKDNVVTHYFSSAKESSDTWAPNVLASL